MAITDLYTTPSSGAWSLHAWSWRAEETEITFNFYFSLATGGDAGTE